MDIYYVNGQFVKEEDALISVNDLSVIRGYGVFDFLRTYNGIPFHLEDHLNRLQNSARLIGLTLPCTVKKIKTLINKGLAQSSHKEKNIRIVVTGGLSNDGITPTKASHLILMITATVAFPSSYYEKGVKLITSHVDRFMPGAKTINYIPAILCQKDAKDQAAVESIYVDKAGYLLEGTTSNLFVVRDGRLITPPCDRVLPGITRQVILNRAKGNVEIVERPVHKDEIRLLDEVFITSSVKEVIPTTVVDAVVIGDGSIGPITQMIMKLFRETSRLNSHSC
ncbi:MAG: branched-chain amino acid aminotransferase [Desulforhopalus sp.]|jgi:branched-chain amino acid aminotransferase